MGFKTAAMDAVCSTTAPVLKEYLFYLTFVLVFFSEIIILTLISSHVTPKRHYLGQNDV